MTLEQLVTQFRQAIDVAFENDDFRSIPPFSRFPNDCCDLTCDLLGQYLLEHGIETYQINGAHKNEPSWHHVWLVTSSHIVVDITCDQFAGKIVSTTDALPIYIGLENSVHKIFCLNRVREENTNFTDSQQFTGFGETPNRRQRVLIDLYRIICKYLK